MSHRTEGGGSDSEKHRLPASTRPGRGIRRMGAVRKTPEESAERRGRSSSRTHGAGSASSEWTSIKRPEGNGKQPTEKREGSPLAHPRDSSAHNPRATIPKSIHTEHHRSASVDRNEKTNSPSPLRSESPFQSYPDAHAFQVAGTGNEIPDDKRLAGREKIEKPHLATSIPSVRTSSPSPLRSESPFQSYPDAHAFQVAGTGNEIPDDKRLAGREKIEKPHLATSIPSVRTSSPSPLRSKSPFASTKPDPYALEVARRGREPPPDRERLTRRKVIENPHLTTSIPSGQTSTPSPPRSESPFASTKPDAYDFEVASRGKEKKHLAQEGEMLTTPSSSVRTSSAGSAGPKGSRFTEDPPIPGASSLNPNANGQLPTNKRSLWESFGDPKRRKIRQENLEPARNQYHPLTEDQAEEIAKATCQAWLGGERRKK